MMVSKEMFLIKPDLLCCNIVEYFPDSHTNISKLFCHFISYVWIDMLHAFSVPAVSFQSFGKGDNFP